MAAVTWAQHVHAAPAVGWSSRMRVGVWAWEYGLGWGTGTDRELTLAVPNRNTSTLVCIFSRDANLYVNVQTTVAPAPINEAWQDQQRIVP